MRREPVNHITHLYIKLYTLRVPNILNMVVSGFQLVLIFIYHWKVNVGLMEPTTVLPSPLAPGGSLCSVIRQGHDAHALGVEVGVANVAGPNRTRNRGGVIGDL